MHEKTITMREANGPPSTTTFPEGLSVSPVNKRLAAEMRRGRLGPEKRHSTRAHERVHARSVDLRRQCT